ncbi:TPA: hypothetical protein ENG04_04910, partial [Candidatus Poribacteria bacterium]|nr:hypothetical protein [Candidatus Poribacteria bacterium]HEX29402.1 hypothetical protein [Candidatus Poribacteria bacterium]
MSVACLIQSEQEFEYVEPLKKYCVSVDATLLRPLRSKVKSLLGLFSRKPLTLPYFFSRELQNLVNKLVTGRRFDLIFVYSSSMAQYVLGLGNVRKILDLV